MSLRHCTLFHSLLVNALAFPASRGLVHALHGAAFIPTVPCGLIELGSIPVYSMCDCHVTVPQALVWVLPRNAVLLGAPSVGMLCWLVTPT